MEWKFKEGDKVDILDPGKVYPTCEPIFKELGFANKKKNYSGFTGFSKTSWIVFGKTNYGGRQLFAIRKNTHELLICGDAIKYMGSIFVTEAIREYIPMSGHRHTAGGATMDHPTSVTHVFNKPNDTMSYNDYEDRLRYEQRRRWEMDGRGRYPTNYEFEMSRQRDRREREESERQRREWDNRTRDIFWSETPKAKKPEDSFFKAIRLKPKPKKKVRVIQLGRFC